MVHFNVFKICFIADFLCFYCNYSKPFKSFDLSFFYVSSSFLITSFSPPTPLLMSVLLLPQLLLKPLLLIHLESVARVTSGLNCKSQKNIDSISVESCTG